jgi:branched-chain amino acid transport system substrate-binding protein
VRAVAVVAAAGMASVGLLTSGASAQSGSAPGVSNNSIDVGYILSQSGIAASTQKGADQACKARIGAQNAKGGVNGRKINLSVLDDQSSLGNNLNAAKDLIQNQNVFLVINNSALGFNSYRYIQSQGVPLIGAGFDGTYYGEKGNENIVSGLGNGAPVNGLTYDNGTKELKKLGVTKLGAVGYGISPSSSASAESTVKYGAPAAGIKSGYLNTSIPFGGTDVGPVILGIKNSGSNGIYLPLNTDTNFAIVQGLQQSNVPMKGILMATGYGQDLLDQPIAKTITPNVIMLTGYAPVELKTKATKLYQANLKKYGGLTGVPNYGGYTGYIECDMLIQGLLGAGKNPTRQGFLDAMHKLDKYDGAGLLCQDFNFTLATFGKAPSTSCQWYVGVKNGKFVVLNGGKPIVGKLVGDPSLLAQNQSGAFATTTTTAAAGG